MTVGSPSVMAADFYVDAATGNDSNDGLTPATAWATLSRALDGSSIDGLPNPELTGNGQDDIVHVAAGTYGLTASIPLPLVDGVIVQGPAADPTNGVPPTAIVSHPTGVQQLFRGTGNLSPNTGLHNLLLRNNNGSSFGGNLVRLDIQGSTMAPQFINNQFEGLLASGSPTGYGIYLDGGAGLPGAFTSSIQDNLFKELNAGIALQDDPMVGRPLQTIAPTVSGNTFTDNATGVWLDAYQLTMTGAQSADYMPTISGNTFSNGQSGIAMSVSISSISGTSDFELSPLISNNTFSGMSLEAVYVGALGSVGVSAVATAHPQILTNAIDSVMGRGMHVRTTFDVNDAARGVATPTITGNTLSNIGADAIYSSVHMVPGLGATAPKMDVSPTITSNTVTGANHGIFAYWYLDGQAFSGSTGTSTLNSNFTLADNHILPTTAPVGPSAVSNGIRFDFWILEFTTANTDLQFNNNEVDAAGGYGIGVVNTSLWLNETGSFNLSLSNNTVTNNTFDGIILNISGNTPGPTVAHSVLVDGNTATGNGGAGLELNFDAASASGAGDIQITNNVLTNNTVAGMRVATEGFVSGNVTLVSCNTITDNVGNGIVQQSITGPAPDYGGGNLASPGNNNIFNNGGGSGSFDFYNLDMPEATEVPPQPIFARNNWWGTTDPLAIEAHVHDDDENSSMRAVDFSTPRLTPAVCGNTPPVGVDDAYATNEDVTLTVPAPGVLANDTDAESNPLTAVLVAGPASGTLTLNADGSFSYVPTANFNGGVSFTYMPNDGIDDGNVTTVTITVNAVNDPPVAASDAFATSEDVPLTQPAPGVLGNDSDVESASLSAVLVSAPSNGTLTVNADGSFTYSPNPNFNGSDSFTYQASDGAASSSAATVTISISAVNDPPVAVNDAYGTNQNTALTVAAPGVLGNDADPEANPLMAMLATAPASGTVTLNSDGSFTYTPNSGFVGSDSFTYQASDGSLNSNVATVSITVNNVNDAPVAVSDAYATAEDTLLVVPAPGVLGNDIDVDADPLTAMVTSAPTRGTLSLNADGSFSYQPFADLNGPDTFTYKASDGSLFSTATVTINVSAVNDAPVTSNDSVSATPGSPVSFNVLANDSDVEGNSLMVTSFTQGSQGSVSCTSAGLCTYTPVSTASGSDSFTYQVSDSNGGLSTGTVSIAIVAACPPAPAIDFPFDGATNVPLSGVMSWSGSAELFEVFFGPVGQGCSMSQASTPNASFRYAGLQPDTEYEWRVAAGKTGCPTESSPCVRFRTERTCTATAPVPVAPAPGAQVSSPVTFRWSGVSGATLYKVFVIVDGNEVEVGRTADTSLTVNIGEASGWYVVAEGAPSCGVLRSVTTPFTVCNAPEPPLASVIGESTSGQTYTVSWPAVAGATRYEVLEADNPQFANAVSFPTSDTFMTFTKVNITRATGFYYQVRAFSDCFNGFGGASPTMRVVVVPVPPRDTPNTNANAPVGSNLPIVLQVFVPGEPGQSLRFTAVGDQPWMTVRPAAGVLPPEGLTLEVLVDPSHLPNGTFTGTVILTLGDPVNGRTGTQSNHIRSTPVSINLVTPVTPVSPGPPNSSSLIIPAVGHLDGGDARWRSDVRIANTTAALGRYLLTFTPGSGEGVKQTSIEIAPGETTALDDIVRAWYGVGSLGESSNGVLEVRPLTTGSNLIAKGDAPNVSLATVVSSRTYAQTQAGTLGEFIPGVLFSQFIGSGDEGQSRPVLNLQQIAQNANYRTNVGVVEASGKAVSTLLTVFNSAGDKVIDIPVELGPNEQKQLNSLLAENDITLTDGRIEVQVTGGDGRVTAYAAVIDNRSRDQLFVPASTLGNISSSLYVVPGIADLDTGNALWRSDVRVFNSGTTSQVTDLTFYPQNNSGAPMRASVTVEPDEVKVLDNVVQSIFGANGVGGAVHVSTPNLSSLVVTARTYNQTTTGTRGLFIPAVTPDEAIANNGRALNVVQAEDSVRYRTNLGLAEMSGKPVTVELMVHLPGSKVTPRIEIPLAANEFRQIAVLRELGIGNVYNARISMKVIGGEGSITAYGSVVDMKTNDSTYVPAQ